MKEKYNKIILLLIMCFSLSMSLAAGTGTDYSALSNNLATVPEIQGATQGYDFLSGKVVQNIPLVKGSIPFTMQYHASLRLDSEAGVNFYQELDEGGVADWTNEYSGYVMTSTNTSTNVSIFVIQLPGNGEKYLLSKEGGKFKRVYYNGGGQFEAKTFYSENLRDISFNQVNGSIVIVKDGIKYTASIYKNLESVFGSKPMPSNLYKFTEIQFQNGRKLNLSYDSGYNLIQVKDNRNNILNILRNYKKAGSSNQSYLERKLITGVELISGSNVQRSTITYQEAQVKSIIDPSKTETRYTVSSIDSIVAGTIGFQYENQNRGYWIQYVWQNTSRNITSADEGSYPILKRVVDQNNNILREYEYANVWAFAANSKIFSVYTTQITAYTPINNQKNQRSISAWNDTRGEFANRFTVNGQDQVMDFTISPPSLSGNYDESNLSVMLSSTSTLTIKGDYPGLLSGFTPIRSVEFNPFTHRLIKLTDFNGNVSKFNYDDLNRLTQKIVASDTVDSQSTIYNYTTLVDGTVNGSPTPNEIVTDSQKVTNSLNSSGWIVKQVISYPKGGDSKTIVYSYYSNSNNIDYGLISSVDGPRTDVDDTILFTYDTFGNKATETQKVNNQSIVTKYLNYNSFAEPERIIQPSGLVSQFIYNADGTLQAQITGTGGSSGNVSGPVTRFTYDYLKRKKSETNPDNELTLYDYDGIGRLVKTTYPDGSTTTQSYFDNGVVQATEGATNTYNEVNVQGRISKSRTGTDTNSNWKTFTYDGNGNIVQTQTALGIVEKWTFDALNRNTAHTDGEGYTSTSTFDKSNNKISEKNAGNVGSSPYTYVSSTLIKDEVNNDYATKSYTYNQNNQLTSKTHGSRSCTFSGIDSLGRTGGISCNSENGNDPALAYNYQYTYDSSRFGRLDKISSATSFGVETQYTYDDYDHVTGKTQTNKSLTTWNGVNGSLSIGYIYTPDGKVKGITMPSGRAVGYNYDGTKGRLASVNIGGNSFISNIAYDSSGQLISWKILNTNASYIIGYDSAKSGAIKSISFNNKSNSLIYREQYNFDKDGRIITVNQLNNINSYSYDNANRLTNENTVSYEYSVTGNRTKANGNRYGYDQGTNRLSVLWDYDYDPIMNTRNLATGEVRSLDFLAMYDGNGQMRYSGGANGQYYMAYNHKNERTVRSINTSGNWYIGATQYLYDENSNLVGEYAPNGTPIVEYVWMGSRPVAAIYGSGTNTKIYTVITDRNNTPRMLVDNSNDAIVWQWQSTAFGVGKPIGNIKFNLRFPGQYYDEYTGLHYNLNRYYNPELGLYMEPDPIGLEGGLNPYVYADNNPLSNIDPSGLDCIGGSCSSGFEQGMYDWWPGYKFGTGLYNSYMSGSNQFSFWEGVDGGATFLGSLGKGLSWTAREVNTFLDNSRFLMPEMTWKRSIGATGSIGEDFLKSLGGRSQVYFSTSNGARYVDQLVGGIAHESKVGYTSLTSPVRAQIAKDSELLQNLRVDGVTWNFFKSPITGKGGPSLPLRKALEDAGIKVKEHY